MTRSLQQYAETKQGLIKAIHTGQRVLGLDDATYRDMVRNAVGRESCAGLSVPQLRRVLDVMRSRGLCAAAASGRPDPQGVCLLACPGRCGKVQDRSRKALDAYARRHLRSRPERADARTALPPD